MPLLDPPLATPSKPWKSRPRESSPRSTRSRVHLWCEQERGQTTAEYALVLIAAATIAMLIVAWAGNTGAINEFFDAIIERITSMLP